MKLHRLIRQVPWPELEAAYRRLYPPEHPEQQMKEGPRAAWDELLVLEPQESDWTLRVDFTDDPDVGPADVYGVSPGDDQHYAIELTDRAELLGMEVRSNEDRWVEDLAASILWEITFYGWTQAEVTAHSEELQRRIEGLRNQTPEAREEMQRKSDEFTREWFPNLAAKQGIDE